MPPTCVRRGVACGIVAAWSADSGLVREQVAAKIIHSVTFGEKLCPIPPDDYLAYSGTAGRGVNAALAPPSKR